MSLDRKDVRAKLDADMHAALSILAEADDVDIGEFIERELLRVIRDRVHAASFIADRTASLGITGKANGKARSGRE